MLTRKIKVPSHENMHPLSRIWIRFGSAVIQINVYLKCLSENYTRNSKPKRTKMHIFFSVVANSFSPGFNLLNNFNGSDFEFKTHVAFFKRQANKRAFAR